MKTWAIIAVITTIGGANMEAAWWKKVVTVVAAPVTAPVAVAKDVVQGKPPSVSKVIEAASPTVAQIAETDRQTGISKTVGQVTQVPEKANAALESAKRAGDNLSEAAKAAQGKLPEIVSAVNDTQGELVMVRKDVAGARSDFRGFLASIALPAQVLLWSLVGLTLIAAGRASGVFAGKR